MKMMIWFCVLGLFLSGTVFSQAKDGFQEKIAEIKLLLGQLEQNYVKKLDFDRRREAIALMDRIIKKLDALAEAKGHPRQQVRMVPEDDFQALMTKLRATIDKNDTLFIISQNATAYNFTTGQLIEIIGVFPFDDERLKAIDAVLPKITDTQNAYRLLDHVKFQSSKNKLKEMIEKYTK
jgi:hypothetical protein